MIILLWPSLSAHILWLHATAFSEKLWIKVCCAAVLLSSKIF